MYVLIDQLTYKIDTINYMTSFFNVWKKFNGVYNKGTKNTIFCKECFVKIKKKTIHR